jgi:hypothetical protein
MKIQHTNISEHKDGIYTVDMLIADDPQPDEGQEKVHVVCDVRLQDPEQYPALLELQVTALDHAKDAIGQQIASIKSVARR